MSFDDHPSPHQRYRRDSMFRALVDTLYMQIENANYTPTELREAAILAAIMHAERQPVRFYLECDCEASGNVFKPKQHGADPHAKNCAIYMGTR